MAWEVDWAYAGAVSDTTAASKAVRIIAIGLGISIGPFSCQYVTRGESLLEPDPVSGRHELQVVRALQEQLTEKCTLRRNDVFAFFALTDSNGVSWTCQ